jgi:hypothetical protein
MLKPIAEMTLTEKVGFMRSEFDIELPKERCEHYVNLMDGDPVLAVGYFKATEATTKDRGGRDKWNREQAAAFATKYHGKK